MRTLTTEADPQITLRVPAELLLAVSQSAQAVGRNLNEEVACMLHECLLGREYFARRGAQLAERAKYSGPVARIA